MRKSPVGRTKFDRGSRVTKFWSRLSEARRRKAWSRRWMPPAANGC